MDRSRPVNRYHRQSQPNPSRQTSNMAIRFDCHQCGREFSALDASAGRETKCPDCGTTLTIPQSSTRAAPEPMIIDETTATPIEAEVVDSPPDTPLNPSSRTKPESPADSAPQPRAERRQNRRSQRRHSSGEPREPSTIEINGRFWLTTAAIFGGCLFVVLFVIALIEML